MVPPEAVALKGTVPMPVLDPGVVLVIVGIAVAVTANVLAVPEPHAVDGVTCMFPDELPAVTVIVLVVPPAV